MRYLEAAKAVKKNMPLDKATAAAAGRTLPRRGPAQVDNERAQDRTLALVRWWRRGKGKHSVALPGGGKGHKELREDECGGREMVASISACAPCPR